MEWWAVAASERWWEHKLSRDLNINVPVDRETDHKSTFGFIFLLWIFRSFHRLLSASLWWQSSATFFLLELLFCHVLLSVCVCVEMDSQKTISTFIQVLKRRLIRLSSRFTTVAQTTVEDETARHILYRLSCDNEHIMILGILVCTITALSLSLYLIHFGIYPKWRGIKRE